MASDERSRDDKKRGAKKRANKEREETLGILVGGGPAPGINSVIAAASIRARVEDVEVLGVEEGFAWLMKRDMNHARRLTINEVSRIHFRGGSIIGTSRANPTREKDDLEATVDTLLGLGITKLITIGGDDTAFSAMKVSETAGGRLDVVHVPKTIDNDLDLPPEIDTFGFQTARHVGAELTKNIMVDAFTTSRWYFIIAMGRKAGHLALGIGKAAGATVTLIPEEFGTEPAPLKLVVDTLVGSIIKRLSDGRRHGVAVIAEGIVLKINPEDLGNLENVERDEFGNVRIAEIDIGDILKRGVKARLKELGLTTTVVAKDVGYELRCADPIPYDMEYTRDLGYCAAKYILNGGSDVMVSMQGGHFVPIPFHDLLDPETGKTKVRLVDVHSTRYAIARRYMLRVRRDDFTNERALAKLATAARLSVDEFRAQFEYLAELEPGPLDLGPPHNEAADA
jgi:6-phosphofructokinase